MFTTNLFDLIGLLLVVLVGGYCIGWLVARSAHMPIEQLDYIENLSWLETLKTLLRWMKWDIKVFISRGKYENL